jgi:hypothetical protein
MKTELILWSGIALMAAVVISSLALAGEQADDWASQSPLAFGEPMEDCDQHHPGPVVQESPAVQPAVIPAVVPVQETEPAKPARLNATTGKTTQRPIPPGTLFTFALMASSGSQIPVTAK